MSIPGILTPLFSTGSSAAAAPVQIERSLRFNSSDSAYLSRTPAVAGNRKTWTWAGWMKRSGFATYQMVFQAGNVGASETFLYFVDGTLRLYQDTSSSVQMSVSALGDLRDPSAWYHIVVAVDTTQATATNRVKIYINGTERTNTSGTYPSQNLDTYLNSTQAHFIGTRVGQIQYFSGYLADIHFIDGQALTPSSFTEVSATTGQLIPKTYAGTYTGNSYWLKFNDNSAATATTLGKDSFLLGNNWTPNNLSVTAGSGNDSLVDTPTSYGTDTGAGGQVRGNYCTWNPLRNDQNAVLTNGNLDLSTAGSVARYGTYTTIGVTSAKWYWEITVGSLSTDGYEIGIASASKSATSALGSDTESYIYLVNGTKRTNNVTLSYGATYTAGDVIGVALNLNDGTLTFYKNGTSQGTAYTSIPSNTWFPSVADDNTGSTVGSSFISNFGQRAFAYTAPSGFKALCDTNLGAPLVALPNTLMDVVLYTGTGASHSITGLNFSPDWVWIKSRSNGAYHHHLIDTVRGATKEIYSNLTNAEGTDPVGLTAFNSDGFTLGSSNEYNASGQTFVAWTWDAGTTTASNTQGSITSQVRANVSAGFSIVTYTGNGVAGATRGHGLGVAPGMILIKGRTNVDLWHVYHSSLGNTQGLFLNSTNAATTSIYFWNNTSPTSTVFTTDLGSSNNSSGVNYVAYCFAPVVGYSSFGSYTGNGSADGPFVYTGFRPAFLMVKGTSAGYIWTIEDNKRDTFNPETKYLQPQASDAEGTLTTQDFTSNGFKIRTADTAWNGSGITYIYMAFAENPFQYARAR